MKQFTPVYIEWIDSFVMNGWVPIEETTVSDLLIKTIGWVVEDGEDAICITPSYSEENVSSPLTIPKCAIINMYTLDWK